MHGRNCRSEIRVRELRDTVKASPRSYLTWSQVICSRRRKGLVERVEVQDVTRRTDHTNPLTTRIWTTMDNQLQLTQAQLSSIIGQLIQASIVLARLLVTLESIRASELDTRPQQRIQDRAWMKFKCIVLEIWSRRHNASPRTVIATTTKRVTMHSHHLVSPIGCMEAASTNETNNKSKQGKSQVSF